MKAINLTLTPRQTPMPLGSSYFWDAPQLPRESCDYPFATYTDDDGRKQRYPLQFICQINLADLPPGSPLPRRGMLYVWGMVDYYMGYDTPFYNGIGPWPAEAVQAVYADVAPEQLERQNPFEEDDMTPPHAVAFEPSDTEADYGLRLLGQPYEEDARQAFDDEWTLLLQMDSMENEHVDLQFHDMGLLYIMIERSRLEKGDFSRLRAYMTSM